MRKKFENSLIKVFIITSFLLLVTAFANIYGVDFMNQTVYAAPGMQINDVNATASSYVTPYSSDRAVNTFQDPTQLYSTSRWYSTNPGAKWLMLDLKKIYYVGGWHVEHLGSLGWDSSRNTRDFQIQTSMDGINWTTVQTISMNTSNVSDVSIAPVTARYARLYIVSGNQFNNTWASVADFHVFAVPLNVLSVQVPADNTYATGNTMNFIVSFPMTVSVNTLGGTPYIPLTVGSKTVNARYISGSGTQNLVFSYTVQNGDFDADGITVGSSINYNGGSINDTSANLPAVITLNNVASTAGVLVDAIPKYIVTIGTLSGGTIAANTASAEAGTAVTLTVTPDSGKQLKAGSLKYNDGTSDTLISGTSFAMPAANVTVSAVFEPIPPTLYSVTIGALTGGNITASTASAVYGAAVTLTVTPDSGMQLKVGSLKYNDGTADILISGTSFTMPAANVTVSAVFEPIPPTLYNVTIGTLSGGNIIANISSAPAGLPVVLTVIPNPGMQLKAGSLKYNDGTSDAVISGTNFIMPAANVTVSAVFEPIPPTLYTVSTATYAHGSIIVNPQIAAAGALITVTAVPDPGYQLKAGNLKYNDGTADTLISGSNFAMPAKNITVSAVFETIPIPPPGTVITPVIAISPDVPMIPNSTLVQVNVSSLTPGAAIRYTTNGDEPTVATAVYGTSFSVSAPGNAGGTVIIKAIALKDGMNPSAVSEKAIKFLPVAQTVPVNVSSITINSAGDAASVTRGNTLQMSAVVLPENATNKTVTWSVYSVTGTASISNTGLLTATGVGTVTVKATANDGSGVSAAKTITITAPISNGGNGGSGGVVNPPPATVVVTTSKGTTTATVTVNVSIVSNGNAAAAVTQAQITEAIDKSIDKAKTQDKDSTIAVEINVDAPAAAASVSISIPQGAVGALAGKVDTFTITSPVATITFSDNALVTINASAQGDIVFNTNKAGSLGSNISEADKAALNGRTIYDFTITSGNKTISSFGSGFATVSIPYTLKPGENPNNVVIYYIADDGKLVKLSHCKYDGATGTVKFVTNHFSKYSVGYNAVSFSDVSGWASDYISFLASKNIVKGTGDGLFSPEADITRAEFITLLANIAGAGTSDNTASAFTDVSSADWFYSAVQWGYKNGIILGSNGKFNPDEKITRQDMALIIARFADKIESYKFAKLNTPVNFKDNTKIADYAKDSVSTMQQAGIISGKGDNVFEPEANATRGEASKMIAVLLQSIVK